YVRRLNIPAVPLKLPLSCWFGLWVTSRLSTTLLPDRQHEHGSKEVGRHEGDEDDERRKQYEATGAAVPCLYQETDSSHDIVFLIVGSLPEHLYSALHKQPRSHINFPQEN
ncbi:unnamed protein product, partial [Ectocarpus sp. 12 AP-2014]